MLIITLMCSFCNKDKEVEELGNKAEDSIAKHAKMVDDLADEASSKQEAQSKQVEKIGKLRRMKSDYATNLDHSILIKAKFCH